LHCAWREGAATGDGVLSSAGAQRYPQRRMAVCSQHKKRTPDAERVSWKGGLWGSRAEKQPHSTALLYQSSIALSTQKMHRAPGSAVRCPAEGESATVKQKAIALFYFISGAQLCQYRKIERLQGRTDGCRVGRIPAGAINNRAPGMAAR